MLLGFDGRTDIYSLGVVLYRMLCGQLPFQAARLLELLQQVTQDEPRPPRQIPDTMNEDGEVFGAARWMASVTRLGQVRLHDLIRSLLNDIGQWRGESQINDDVSIVAVEVA